MRQTLPQDLLLTAQDISVLLSDGSQAAPQTVELLSETAHLVQKEPIHAQQQYQGSSGSQGQALIFVHFRPLQFDKKAIKKSEPEEVHYMEVYFPIG